MYIQVCPHVPTVLRNLVLSSTRRLTTNTALSPSRPSNEHFANRITPATSTLDSQTITLPSSRKLGFSEYGSPSGSPLLCFHGLPGSRLDWADWDSLGKKLDIRVLGLDRPGFGLSTFQPNRTVLDWPEDVRRLTQHLGLCEYRIIGGSGGGPYTLACAKMLPKEELHGVGMIACMGPWEAGMGGFSLAGKMMWGGMSWFPSLVGKLMARPYETAARSLDSSDMVKLVDKALKWMREKDAAVFKDEVPRMHFVETLRQAFRQGDATFIQEARLLTKPWGFRLGDIKEQKVYLWHGSENVNTPARMGRWMAQQLPNAQMKEFPGDTHFTIYPSREEEILREFMAE